MCAGGQLRSLLFVPGDNPSKLTKARGIPADALVLDWEDSVFPRDKSKARALTVEFLQRRAGLATAILVRVNPTASDCFEEDALALAARMPDGVVLSKCRSAEEVRLLEQRLKKTDPTSTCLMFPMVESAEGLLNAHAIAKSSARIGGVLFGAEDFSADVGIRTTAEESELLYARSALVTACRAAGCDPVDSPCLEFRDGRQVRAAAERARNFGFAGKLAIHPAQVPTLNEVFSPSEPEIEEARRILAVYASSATGAARVAGRMVDEAVARQARRILRLVESGADLRSRKHG
jgi:citrate lyase subunit beta/citryl-CoA lyase